MSYPILYQAIVTKYLGPTNVKGSRVKASAQATSVTLHWDAALNADGNHRAAALALCAKQGWVGPYYGELYGGVLPDNQGYAWVFGPSPKLDCSK